MKRYGNQNVQQRYLETNNMEIGEALKLQKSFEEV
jgi:hypothetical protein